MVEMVRDRVYDRAEHTQDDPLKKLGREGAISHARKSLPTVARCGSSPLSAGDNDNTAGGFGVDKREHYNL